MSDGGGLLLRATGGREREGREVESNAAESDGGEVLL